MKKIKLSQGEFAIVDSEDFEKINQHNWYCDNNRAVRNSKMVSYQRGKKILMHREVMGASDGSQIDHINRNPLDNRKINLRIVTASQNQMNRVVGGVYWHKRAKKWQVTISKNRKQRHIGYFESKEVAVKARREAERKYFGEYAHD